MAVSPRGLSWLGLSGLLATARAQCCDKGWWHQLGKSSPNMETQLKSHPESWRAQEFRRKGISPFFCKSALNPHLEDPQDAAVQDGKTFFGAIWCCIAVYGFNPKNLIIPTVAHE